MKGLIFYLLLFEALICIPQVATAQVTIGSTDTPAQFSVLQLESNNLQGLRLPQFTTKQRTDMSDDFKEIEELNELARGLMIFNTETKSLEYWDGNKWITYSQSTVTNPKARRIKSDDLDK